MKALDVAKKYYEDYGKAIFENDFPELKEHVAIGLIGEGSECLGFDDDISKDHDTGLGFTIFTDDTIDEKAEFKLMRAYNNLPKEYVGYKRDLVSPVGGNRKGVVKLSGFIKKTIGTSDEHVSIEQYLTLPQYAMLNVTNGEVWHDGFMVLTRLRENIKAMPKDCFLKRLVGHILLMNQSGQYNFDRALKRSEYGAAALAINEFVNAAFEVMFLLSGQFMPFYKWKFKMLKSFNNKFSVLADDLYTLMTTQNEGEAGKKKQEIIEKIITVIVEELQNRGITKASCHDLEQHAISINDFIKDVNIRNLNIMYCV